MLFLRFDFLVDYYYVSRSSKYLGQKLQGSFFCFENTVVGYSTLERKDGIAVNSIVLVVPMIINY